MTDSVCCLKIYFFGVIDVFIGCLGVVHCSSYLYENGAYSYTQSVPAYQASSIRPSQNGIIHLLSREEETRILVWVLGVVLRMKKISGSQGVVLVFTR